jgi:hypothetical protein
MTIIDSLPPLRQSSCFNITDGNTVAFNQPLDTLLAIKKMGTGSLILNRQAFPYGSWEVLEGKMTIKNSLSSKSILIDGGTLDIDTDFAYQKYPLILKKGQINLLNSITFFEEPIEIGGTDLTFGLNANQVYFHKGLKGTGAISIVGPGLVNLNQGHNFNGILDLNHLTLNPIELGTNLKISCNNVIFKLNKDFRLDSSTSLDIGSQGLIIDHAEHNLEITTSLKGTGTIQIKGQGGIGLHSPGLFEGVWIQQEGKLHLQSKIHHLVINKNASLKGSGSFNLLDLKGSWYPILKEDNSQEKIQTQEGQITGLVTLTPYKGSYKPGSFRLVESDNLVFDPSTILAPAQFEGEIVKDSKGVVYQLKKFHEIQDYIDKGKADDRILAAHFDKLFAPPGSDVDKLIAQLLSLKSEPEALIKSMQGHQPAYFSALGLTQESNFILARSALSNRMQELITFPCAKEYVWDMPGCMWIDPVGDFTEQEPRQNDMGYNSASIGAFMGIDGKIHPKFRFGINLGYTNSRVNWMEDVGRGIINSAYLSGYFLYKPSQFYLNGSLCGGYSHYNANRYINSGQIKQIANHKNHGLGFSGDFELGYLIRGKTTTQPFLRQSYIGLWQQKFIETGAGSYNYAVNAKYFSMYRAEGGLIFNRCFNFEKWALTPEITISGIWEQELNKGYFEAHYASMPDEPDFEVAGMKPQRLMFSPGASLDAVIKKYPMMIGVRYHAELCPQYYDQRISGHWAYSF